MAAISCVSASCGARVASVSSMFAMSETSQIVAAASTLSKRIQRARHASTVPTAGGHAHDLLYMGHSLRQMSRTRSVKVSSSVFKNSY